MLTVGPPCQVQIFAPSPEAREKGAATGGDRRSLGGWRCLGWIQGLVPRRREEELVAGDHLNGGEVDGGGGTSGGGWGSPGSGLGVELEQWFDVVV